jgi:hypothetical protein
MAPRNTPGSRARFWRRGRFRIRAVLGAGLAGHRARSPLLHIPLPLAMYFRHQRTCSVNDRQSKRGGFRPDGAGNARGSAPRHFRHAGTFFPGLGSPGHPLLYVLTELRRTSSSDWR